MSILSYIWPVALVVISNTMYHICTKSVPEGASPFLALTVTYIVGAIFCAVIFFFTNPHTDPLKELAKVNWTSYVLGIVIVGLEIGNIFAYKNGWAISVASIVESAFLAIVLIFVGAFIYKENFTAKKIIGIAMSLLGLVFINM